MTIKKCFKCLCEKPLDAFYKHGRMADGHLNKCKECTKSDAGKHRSENIERIRQYDNMRASMPHRVAQRREIYDKWKQENPDRRSAQLKLGYAVKAGIVQKYPCMVCGESKSEGHHPDYSRPTDVVWLCRQHHMQAHALVTTTTQNGPPTEAVFL